MVLGFFGFGGLLYVSILLTNAIAILSEDRFLARIGWGSTPQSPSFGGAIDNTSVKARIVNLIASVRTLMRSTYPRAPSNPSLNRRPFSAPLFYSIHYAASAAILPLLLSVNRQANPTATNSPPHRHQHHGDHLRADSRLAAPERPGRITSRAQGPPCERRCRYRGLETGSQSLRVPRDDAEGMA
ncbi:hypothetical protein MMC18_004595 [Xylographa bjoerkii]|nr:hypothetical protein [Xylographa bjoerkii]